MTIEPYNYNDEPSGRSETLVQSLVDDRKDETKGILAIATLGTSSAIKGVVKSIKKAGEELDD